MPNYPLTALVTLLFCLLMLGTGFHVGRARGLYGVKAPAMTGHDLFERAYRIQMNTLETAAIALPAMWVCAAFVSDRSAAAWGTGWVLSRIWYAVAYQRNPAKRSAAFATSMVMFGAMWISGAWGLLGPHLH